MRSNTVFARELVKLNARNTLSEIVIELEKYLASEDFGSLNMFHRTFMMTFRFLPEIWNRILEDARLDVEYWKVYIDLYQPGVDERQPTVEELKILNTWRRHRFRLNLDIEDWFIHSYLLMDKFAKFVKRLTQLISKTPQELKLANDIPDRSFEKHRKFYLNSKKQRQITDTGYAEIIRKNTTWYIKELKNIRDDLIQHETVPRFWGYNVSRNRMRLSRFRHDPKLLEILYELRDKYAPIYPQLEGERNFFTLFAFFEEHIGNLDDKDVKRVEHVRKSYGSRFPDIPKLYNKMSNFFCLVNKHFVLEILKRFEQ